jgi:hypothetical protein
LRMAAAALVFVCLAVSAVCFVYVQTGGASWLNAQNLGVGGNDARDSSAPLPILGINLLSWMLIIFAVGVIFAGLYTFKGWMS